MSNTYEIKIARPSKEAIERFYALLHAGEDAENRFFPESGSDVVTRLREDDCNDEEVAFFTAAWDAIANTGDLGRLLCAYTSLDATFQDQELDWLAAKPSLKQMEADAALLPVVLEAYEQAKREITYLTTACHVAEEVLSKARNGEK